MAFGAGACMRKTEECGVADEEIGVKKSEHVMRSG
jgi:hypothetical protein